MQMPELKKRKEERKTSIKAQLNSAGTSDGIKLEKNAKVVCIKPA